MGKKTQFIVNRVKQTLTPAFSALRLDITNLNVILLKFSPINSRIFLLPPRPRLPQGTLAGAGDSVEEARTLGLWWPAVTCLYRGN